MKFRITLEFLSREKTKSYLWKIIGNNIVGYSGKLRRWICIHDGNLPKDCNDYWRSTAFCGVEPEEASFMLSKEMSIPVHYKEVKGFDIYPKKYENLGVNVDNVMNMIDGLSESDKNELFRKLSDEI